MHDRPYLLVAGDFRQTGGMDQANWALARYLAGRGREVHLVAYTASEDLVSCPNVCWRRVERIRGSYFLSEPRLRRAGLETAARIQARGGHVVVNGGNCPWPDVNWVHYVHRAFQPQPRRLSLAAKHWVFCRAEIAALRQARLIVANSDATRKLLIERLALPEERIETIYYGSAPDRFSPASDQQRQLLREKVGLEKGPPVFAFAGQLTDLRKGFDRLFAAWKEFCKHPGNDAILVVIGAGRSAAAWETRARHEGLGDRIRFLGFRPDIENVFRACDALVLPARYEPFGLVVQEALCCGIPAIVSRAAGAAEVYPPELEPLLLDDPEDTRELVAKLVHLSANLTHYRQATLQLASRLHRYTWDDMARRMVERIEA